MQSALYVGIKGRVAALNSETGEQIWSTPLDGGDFVNVLVETDCIFASTRGKVFCLDATSGAVRWKNEMPGCGFGITSLATNTSASDVSMAEAKRRSDIGDDTVG